MRLHILRVAEFAALMTLGVVITHTLGYQAQDSFKPARHIAGVDEVRIQTSASLIPGSTVPVLRANVRGKPWDRHRETYRLTDSTSPVSEGWVAAPVMAIAESDASAISSIWNELKATVTLLRAYSSWIRASSESISDPIG